MSVKLVAFAAVLEYALLKPYIIPQDTDGYEPTDFIGYALSMAVFACFGEISLEGLPDPARKIVIRNGMLGGLVGYAWLLFHVRYVDRQMYHLLVANFMMLVGVVGGSWNQRRRKKGPIWREPK